MRTTLVRYFMLGLGIILVSGLLALVRRAAPPHEYTFAEVIAAYEAGQFRIIHTRSNALSMSPNGDYVIAGNDGLYRVSDWTFWDIPLSNRFQFSPDGRYVAHDYDGIYRLTDFKEIIPIVSEEVRIGDTLFGTGKADFSPNGEYVSVTGAGVYRLSDLQLAVQTDSLEVNISPNSEYVATSLDGVFRLSDGQKLFDMYGYYPYFSPDGNYAYAWQDGLYRVSDGERLFSIFDSPPYFSPDMTYALAPGDGVYWLSDGQKLLDFGGDSRYCGGGFSPDSQYVVDCGVYRLSDGQKVFDTSAVAFSPDSMLIAVSRDGVYRLSDGQKLFDIDGIVGCFEGYCTRGFRESGMYFVVGGDVYSQSNGQRITDRIVIDTFSPDGMYSASDNDGVYQLNDGQKVFDIEGLANEFSVDSDYLTTRASSNVYRVVDGYRYQGLRVLDASAGIMAVGNSILIVDLKQANQRLDVAAVETTQPLFREPNTEAEIVDHIYAIGFDEYFTILNEQDGWYQISYSPEEIGWVVATGVMRLNLP